MHNKPTIEEIIAVIQHNSYQMCFGRSLTSGELLLANVTKCHLKLIGPSQYGKSSAAAAFMRILTETHDPQHIQLALLDAENQTCKLFADLPHVARYQDIPLVARSRQQVLEYLGLLVELMDYRYTLSRHELLSLPVLMVYLEELSMLRDYFKQAQYTQFISCISELVRRGLKVRVQLLACSQDCRADAEIWLNILSGLSFSMRPAAALAAGFTQRELLEQNARDREIGQFVVECNEIQDIGIAPEFDLERMLVTWESAQR